MTLHLPTTIQTFETKKQFDIAKQQGRVSDNDAYIILGNEPATTTGVTSINGSTGDVTITAKDLSAITTADIQVGEKAENGYTQHYLKADALEIAHGQRSDAPEYYFEDFANVKCGNINYAMKETRSAGGSLEGREENLTIGNLFGAKLEQTDPFNGEVVFKFGNTTVTESQLQHLLTLI